MTIKELAINGVFEIQLEAKEDFRGFFMRTYEDAAFAKYGLNKNWVQEYHNLSLKKGTIRGLHFQLPPYSEAKLVRCIAGSTLDVFVDLRKDSPTFGKYGSITLSADNKKMLFIPPGFAHALCALEDNTMVICKLDKAYAPESECQIRWNDSDLNIDWHIESQPIVSEKDANATSFKEFTQTYGAI
ncbi:MAG: dTDP-4-dehydrorhamnose 3,5-epimerase [Candidatus Staskawiczbacteria bacterium RIFCSPHIGHO2_02_FULL_43_16]|uniref:dTDP-4-dehydrorhamnose 3,5-epimerase n=1 Tax=Candidatus Staskawiczbacteria bacterium RIFCSPHIGHO2_01_FULL_41_41 TaxID=1802203 RepID=A0A1G2HT38_9BACT|nr:MAG: dTDP-4-dehydrorhamnose 3,5-epimerase [Candidatus Staskawiczbacteria bacterium RIFCSPHIGHO2_01_FULL_41_41]OGZ68004.1 MAG: dTDP-4-dehydrorhamnose 3,5-epimerase [Candidatus Staskawiczbacteria bacterium RIFCSPHIGHO2_02_FULL_43_16]OGZ74569.1 MAG: dTDP-4-dehydrorhamnose 3,5-epimerase [Candidatus Staskawiczbacteria bacterium RIFCSPLOWO2_01_FULL_43_17b]